MVRSQSLLSMVMGEVQEPVGWHLLFGSTIYIKVRRQNQKTLSEKKIMKSTQVVHSQNRRSNGDLEKIPGPWCVLRKTVVCFPLP